MHSSTRGTPIQHTVCLEGCYVQHAPHSATHLAWSPLCPPYRGEQTRTNLNAPVLFPLFFQFSLETQSPQLLSTEDTFPVGKGEGQQRFHSDVTLEFTVPGTKLLASDKLPTSHLLLMEKQVCSITHIRMQRVWARRDHLT